MTFPISILHLKNPQVSGCKSKAQPTAVPLLPAIREAQGHLRCPGFALRALRALRHCGLLPVSRPCIFPGAGIQLGHGTESDPNHGAKAPKNEKDQNRSRIKVRLCYIE